MQNRQPALGRRPMVIFAGDLPVWPGMDKLGAMRRRVIIGRVVGGVLMLAAVVALSVELYRWASGGEYLVLSIGEIWVAINANSLVGFGAVIEQRISPWLWLEVIVRLLTLPAGLVLGVSGGLVLWGFRHRRRRPMFRKR